MKFAYLWEIPRKNGLEAHLGLKESSQGRTSYFSPSGKLALMFLKSYSCLSDSQLIDNLNSNIHYQLFCGIRVNPLNPLTNFKIVSEIRCEIASLLHVDSLQKVLSSYWKPYLDNLQVHMTDATCYESYIRYPTDTKLLWECIYWLYPKTCTLYKQLGLKKPRSKYDKQRRRYLQYSKKRRRSVVESRVLTRSLLHLLEKIIGFTEPVIRLEQITMSKRFHKRYQVVKQILSQQRLRFKGEKINDVIVSIDKPFIHPIVRGKESKSVEFGAKVNMIQVDGINFIEHLCFSAFHEGIRLPRCVHQHRHLFNCRVSHLAAYPQCRILLLITTIPSDSRRCCISLEAPKLSFPESTPLTDHPVCRQLLLTFPTARDSMPHTIRKLLERPIPWRWLRLWLFCRKWELHEMDQGLYPFTDSSSTKFKSNASNEGEFWEMNSGSTSFIKDTVDITSTSRASFSNFR